MRLATTASTVGTIAGMLLIAGCGSSSSERINEPASSAITTAEPSQTPEPDPEPTHLFSYTWVNEVGYRYKVDVAAPELKATVDIANAQPGFAYVSFKFTAQADLANLTPERNAPTRVEVFMLPYWRSDSVVCANEDAGSTYEPIRDKYCTWQAGEGLVFGEGAILGAAVAEIPVDSSLPLSTERTGRWTVDEADADAFAAALESPDAWVLGRFVSVDEKNPPFDQDDPNVKWCPGGSGGIFGIRPIVATSVDVGCPLPDVS